MGKLKSSITPQHWLQLKRFLFNRLLHAFDGLHDSINFFILYSVFLPEVIKEKATAQSTRANQL